MPNTLGKMLMQDELLGIKIMYPKVSINANYVSIYHFSPFHSWKGICSIFQLHNDNLRFRGSRSNTAHFLSISATQGEAFDSQSYQGRHPD